MIPRELFARYVKDALANFYDPVHLQTHPLAGLLLSSHDPQQTRGQRLRELLREAIESLRPEASVPFGNPEWLGYRLMWLRYIKSLEQPEVCRELALSRTSFYRSHQEAFEAVVSVLWELYERQRLAVGDRSGQLPGVTAESLAKEAAVKVAHEAQRQLVDLGEVLKGAIRTVRPLAEQQGVALRVSAPEDLPMTFGDPAMLRQIVLGVLTEGIGLLEANRLELEVTLTDEGTLWRVSGLDEGKVSRRGNEGITGFAVSQGLLSVYGGRLWWQRDEQGRPVLCFRIPTIKPKTILIIDDDADTVRLYQRYLQGQNYVLRVAHSGEQAQALIAESTPDLILLDVLMPREDGWDILQRLRAAPETARIPVVICSVLSQSRLALALGAADVLGKPLEQAALLRTIERLLHQRGNGAGARQEGPSGTEGR
jgi:CheY-like chemotaxis protein